MVKEYVNLSNLYDPPNLHSVPLRLSGQGCKSQTFIHWEGAHPGSYNDWG